MRARHTITIGLLAASALVVAGCSSDSEPAAVVSPTSQVTVTATVTETAAPTPTSTATGSPTTGSGGSECATTDVKATVTAAQAGAGQRQAFLVLTNTSDSTCTVTGYAGLQLQTAAGADVPTKVVRVSAPAPKTVKVKPGGSTSSTITFGVVPSGNEPETGPCEPEASKVKVIPPDATTSVTAVWDLGPVCGKGKISANAFVAGNGS